MRARLACHFGARGCDVRIGRQYGRIAISEHQEITMSQGIQLVVYPVKDLAQDFHGPFLEADGRDYAIKHTVAPVPPSLSTMVSTKLEIPPPIYGPPLSSCTPFESILAQEVSTVGLYVHILTCCSTFSFFLFHILCIFSKLFLFSSLKLD